MTFNLPYQARAGLYLLTAIGTPVVGYLFAKEIIGELEVAFWSAEVTVVSTLALFNTTPSEEAL